MSVTNAARGQRGRSSGFKTRRRVTPPVLIDCIRCHGGLSDILRDSSDALTAAIFFGVASLMKAPPRPDDAKSTHRLLLAAGTEQIAPAFVIEAMNGTGASPAVRIKGRQA
jgi:hypothetical protein